MVGVKMEHININCETGEISAIPLTDKEKAEQEATAQKVSKDNELIKEQEAKAEADKITAQAKLAALGFTADDLKALGL